MVRRFSAAPFFAVSSFAYVVLSKWMSTGDKPQPNLSRPRIAVVTGGNKGIGLEIVRGLAKHKGIFPILTARSPEKGKAAADELKKEGVEVGFHSMDVNDKKSIGAFTEWTLKTYGNIDILVNNAAIAFDWMGSSAPPMTEQVVKSMQTNFWGTLDVIDALSPHMNKGGAIVNVASGLGKSAYASTAKKWRKSFADPKLDRKTLCQLAESYIGAGRVGRAREQGWPDSAYGTSKMFLMHYTRLLGAELKSRDIACNSMCPGWCSTDMGGGSAPRSAAQGADTAVWLATREGEDRAMGKHFYDRKMDPFNP